MRRVYRNAHIALIGSLLLVAVAFEASAALTDKMPVEARVQAPIGDGRL